MVYRRLTLRLMGAALCWLVGASLPPRSTHAQNLGISQVIQLEIGEQVLIPAAGVRSFSEGKKRVVDIRLTPDGKDFVLVGTGPGSTTLLLLYENQSEKNYLIEVVGAPSIEPQKSYGPGTVELRDNIQLDVYFLDVTDNYSHQLGLAWPGSIGGNLEAAIDLGTGALQSATIAIGKNLLPRLDMAQTTGWAKLLRKSAVIAANGASASFWAGGEINVPVTGGLGGAMIHEIKYGSLIEVTPRYDSDSARVEVELNIAMSDLSNDHGTGVPGRSTSKLQSLVNLELGQALVLAGLNSASTRKDHTGLPLLSQIPIIGGLFGTHASDSEDRKTIIVIQPTVRNATKLDARALIQGTVDSYEDYDGDLEETAFPTTVTDRAARRELSR